MNHYGKRKRGGNKVELIWQKEGLNRCLQVVDVSGKSVAVIELDPETVQQLLIDYW